MKPSLAFVLALVVAAASAHAGTAHGATFVITNNDGPGEGLNDPTPVAPVGGNPGTTVGEQRRHVFEYAAGVWGQALRSNVTIQITGQFDPLTCSASSGVLGQAGPALIFRDFDGAGPGIDLAGVVLHEIAHGLGFLTFVDPPTGLEILDAPDAFELQMRDLDLGQAWPNLTDSGRATSAINARSVAFVGPMVAAAAPARLSLGAPVLAVSGIGELPVGLAQFGPQLASPPVVASVVQAQDGAGASPTDACEPILNSLSGRIALIDRGTCAFTQKVSRAQSAGAVAALIVNNMPGSPPPDLAGTDASITIPSVMVSQADGVSLKAALAAGSITASLGSDASRRLGADASNHPFLYTPNPIAPGSSLSHWDRLPTPSLLMEPVISGDETHDLDLTRPAMADLGWSLASPAPAVPALPRGTAVLAAALLGLVGALALRRRPRVS